MRHISIVGAEYRLFLACCIEPFIGSSKVGDPHVFLHRISGQL
jgi:hypothetical protein